MMRIVVGFFLALVSAVIAFFVYIGFSPIFSMLNAMKPGIDTTHMTPGLDASLTFAWGSGWIYLVLFIVIFSVLVIFVQIYLKEQRRQDYYY